MRLPNKEVFKKILKDTKEAGWKKYALLATRFIFESIMIYLVYIEAGIFTACAIIIGITMLEFQIRSNAIYHRAVHSMNGHLKDLLKLLDKKNEIQELKDIIEELEQEKYIN